MDDEKSNKIMSSEELDDVLPKYEPIKLSGKNLAQNYVSAFNTGMNIYQCVNQLQGSIVETVHAVNNVVESWNDSVDETLNKSIEITEKTTTEQFNKEWTAKQPELIEQVNTLTTNQFNNEKSVFNDELDTLNARMDTFTSLSEGSTTGDAELKDIRVGANGITYNNAGDAVRGQYSQLKEDLDNKLPKSPVNWGPWTAEEQAEARERIGADGGEMELIAEVTTTEELDVISVRNFPDGTQLKLKSFMIYFVIPKASSDNLINCGYKMNYGNNLSINRDSSNNLIKSGFNTHNNMYVLWNNARPIGIVTKNASWANGSTEIESVIKYDNYLDGNANYISEVHLSKYTNGIKIPSGTMLKLYGVRV